MPNATTRRRLIGGLGVAALHPFPAKARDTKGVVLYTPNSVQAVDALLGTARKAQPPIAFNTVKGESEQLLRRIAAEAGRPQADIFWSTSGNAMDEFTSLFAPYATPAVDAIIPELRRSSNLLTATNIHLVVAMVNQNRLGGTPAPKSWEDLLDPVWRNRIAVADPAISSTGYTIMWGVEQLLGADGLRRLAANLRLNTSALAVLRSVAQGEFAVGLTLESNAYAYIDGGQQEIALIYPADGTFQTTEYAALVKGAPAARQAEHGFDLLFSYEAQVALLEAAFRRPSRMDIDVTRHTHLPHLKSVRVFPTDDNEAGNKRGEFLARWRNIMVDVAR